MLHNSCLVILYVYPNNTQFPRHVDLLMMCIVSEIDLGVGSIKSTWAFQVGSSRSVVASPSKFSGAVGFITSRFKST